jgi:hypothetical protein
MWKILCKKDRSGGAEFKPFKSFKSFKPMKTGRAMQAITDLKTRGSA